MRMIDAKEAMKIVGFEKSKFYQPRRKAPSFRAGI